MTVARKGEKGQRLKDTRILVLDDDDAVRRLVNHTLTKHGCLVETAADGYEGLQKLLRRDYDVVVVDIRMEGMDGLTFLQEAKKIWPWIAVIIVSGYASEPVAAQARELNVASVLSKPIDFDALCALIQEEADKKRERLQMPAETTLDQLQQHMSVFRQLSEAAFSAENQVESLHSLSMGLGRMLPCSVVGILDTQSIQRSLFIIAQEAVAPEYIETIKHDMFRRIEALTNRKLSERDIRIQVEGMPCDAGAARKAGSTFTVPIVAAGQVSGLLMLASTKENAYSATDISFLYHTANHLSTIFAALSKMRQLAVNDSLTSVYNRGQLEKELDRAWLLARRHEHSISVIVVDIDDFKKLNDTYGHLVGDTVLREFSAILSEHTRTSDIAGRYGGDEFVLVLQHTNARGSLRFAERLCAAVGNTVFCESTHRISLTVSIGVATSRDDDDQEAGFDVLAEADHALYMAKKTGKNKVCQWTENKVSVEIAIGGAQKDGDGIRPEATKGHVLVVDDDPNIGLLLKRILNDANYAVESTTSIAQATNMFSASGGLFDVVITDINLPEESGFELLQTLSSSDIPVIKIVITGDVTLDNAIASMRYGVYDFIPKPILPEQLLAVLSRAMEYRRLALENTRYKRHLEDMVREKSAALVAALNETKRSYDFTLEALVAMLDAREHKTGQHSIRVRDMAIILAQEMDVTEEQLQIIAHGALLHDIGKIAIPDAILLKPGPLTNEEWDVIRSHPEVGYRVLQTSSFLKGAAEIVRSHQECFDGSGYPRSLRGSEICIGARIFAVVDAYDAMRSDREYQQPMPIKDTVAEIKRERGKQFDPEVVDAFLKCQAEIERGRSRTMAYPAPDITDIPRASSA